MEIAQCVRFEQMVDQDDTVRQVVPFFNRQSVAVNRSHSR